MNVFFTNFSGVCSRKRSETECDNLGGIKDVTQDHEISVSQCSQHTDGQGNCVNSSPALAPTTNFDYFEIS